MGKHDKLLHVFGLLAKLQSEYDTPATLSTTEDGFLPFFEGRDPYSNLITLEPQYDGSNGVNITSLLPALRTAPNGFTFRGTIPHRFRGPNDVYDGAVVPPWDAMMKMAGFAAATAASKRSYVPVAPGVAWDIGTIGAYMRGGTELYVGMNVIANLMIESQGYAPPLVNFDCSGVRSARPTTVGSFPSITYPGAAVQPAVGTGLVANIGDFINLVLKSWSFNAGRDVATIMADLTANAGLIGFGSGGWDPELKLVIASTALQGTPFHHADGINEYALHDEATNIPISAEWGIVDATGNHVRIKATSAQLKGPPVHGNEGPVATSELTFQLNDLTIECESEEESS